MDVSLLMLAVPLVIVILVVVLVIVIANGRRSGVDEPTARRADDSGSAVTGGVAATGAMLAIDADPPRPPESGTRGDDGGTWGDDGGGGGFDSGGGGGDGGGGGGGD